MADLQFRATGVLLNPYASKRPATSIAFSRARSRQICRCRHRTSTSSSSTSRPPRRWVSKCHRRCSRGLFLRHIGKFNKLASVRERDPGVSHTHIIFALLRVVCFLCKHRALSGRFPCRVAFGSHLFDSPVGPPFTLTLSMLRPWSLQRDSPFCCWNQFVASRFHRRPTIPDL